MTQNDMNEEKGMKDEILRKINADTVRMRPKVYFTIQVGSLIILVLMILVVSVFICNFILFGIRLNNHDTLLGFGPRGIEAFLMLFPWSLLILDAALVVLLEWLLRQFRFGYKSPVLFLFLALILITGAVGLILDRETPLNDMLLRGSDEHLLPAPFGDVYGRARHLPPDAGFCKCTISAIDGGTLTVVDSRGTTTLKVILPEDDARATTSGLTVGDTILVAGDRDGETIRAFGVRKVSPDVRGQEPSFFFISSQ